MGKGSLLLSLVCSLFVFEGVQCWSLVKKEAGCKIRTTSGECCVFPFKYNGKTYKSCTVDNHDKMWCSRTPDYDSDSKWGNCKFEDCQIKTTDDVCCVFPFYYNFRKYYGCTTKYHRGKAWCGTQKYVFWGHGGWGECVTCDKPKALGIETGKIPDSAFTASSVYGSNLPQNGRLNKVGSYCSWLPHVPDGSWLQVDFGQKTIVTGVATQGSCYSDGWTKSFSVAYSSDTANWTYFQESGARKVFSANNDYTTVVTNYFKPPIFARYIRILPQTWNVWSYLRIEYYGCHL